MASIHDAANYPSPPLMVDAAPQYPQEHYEYQDQPADSAAYAPLARSASNGKSYAARASARPDLFLETSPPEPAPASHSPTSPNDPYTLPLAAAAPMPRKGSVSDRSPLQHLEVKLGDISKEEKRARIEQAEQLARQRSDARRAPDNWTSTRTATQEALRKQPVPAQRSTRSREQGSSRPIPPEPATPTRDYNYPSPRVRSYGYDSALTGGAAAAAVGAYQASRRRNYESRAPVVASATNALETPSWVRSAPTQPRSGDIPIAGVQNPAQANLEEPRVDGDRAVAAVAPDVPNITLPSDPLPPQNLAAPVYQLPPQSAAGQQPRKQVAFKTDAPDDTTMSHNDIPEQYRFRDVLHRTQKQGRRYEAVKPLDEWTRADTVILTSDELDIDSSSNAPTSKAWWERSGAETNYHSDFGASHTENPMETTFKPALHLRCGPLLRYTGIRLDPTTEKEFWRGSVMIVTHDSISSYEAAPVLRLFKQSMDLVPPPPPQGSTQESAGQTNTAANVDPVAGLPKVSRTGQTLFTKPVHEIDGELDLSQMETDEGLFSQKPPAQNESSALSRIHSQDGESVGRYREVKAVRLHAERGVTFWRFNMQVELGATQNRIAYRINGGPATGFWVPARGQSMNVMFHSCNGFSLSVNPNEFSGPDPLWRDVLNNHQIRPFHCMIGGGDQIYNDAAMRQTQHFQAWLAVHNPHEKHAADFSVEMQNELEQFYLDRYAMWFSQGFFGFANSQIPMINVWDDHDIIDGFGSYPHHFMSTPVFTGVGAVAFKYYMLFQHQSIIDETEQTEPYWLLGAAPGPYINQLSRSIFLSLGKGVALLGLDCRTERMRDEVLSQGTYDLVFDRCRREINQGETKHLIVLLGVPIAYPRLNFLENILTSRAMDPLKALGRTKILSGFVNKFDGGVEILDDLDDHWTAKHHKQERNWFIQELQELAAEKSVRITILGGDVHLAAVGQFYSNPKLGIPKDHDHRYMPNVISSAIVNTPPPEMMGDVLNKRNKIHHLDNDTDEDMIPMFLNDVTGQSRNNHHLLPRRNWCSIREYFPGSTPPPTPPPERYEEEDEGRTGRRRSFSFSRSRSRNSSISRADSEKRGFFRRLSSRRAAPPSSYHGPNSMGDDYSYNSSSQDVKADDFIEGNAHNRDGVPSSMRSSEDTEGEERGRQTLPRSFSFQRRPTKLSRRASKSDRSGREGNINLQGGLDIVINCEINQRDPAGFTMPYRLIVPALSYQGPGDQNIMPTKSSSGGAVSSFLGSFRRDKTLGDGQGMEAEAVPYDAHEVRSTPPLGGRAMPESALAGQRSLVQQNGEVLPDRDLPSGQAPSPFKGEVPTPLEDTSGLHSQQASAGGAPYQKGPVSFAAAPLGISSLDASSRDMPARASSNRETGERPTAPVRRYSASGPPPPENINQLPASVRKRYTQLNDPEIKAYAPAIDPPRKRYSQMNDPAASKRFSQYEPFSRSQPPPQRHSAPLPPPKPEDTHRRYSSGPMEMPLLPTNINQLRSSTHRTLQSIDSSYDQPSNQRSVSDPQPTLTSNKATPVVAQDQPSSQSQNYSSANGGNDAPARSNTYHGVSSTAVAPSMVPLSRGQAKRNTGIPSYPSPLTSHAPQADQYTSFDDTPNTGPAPIVRNSGIIAAANTTQPLSREYHDEAYGYRDSGDATRSRPSWGYSHTGMPDKVARHFGGYDGTTAPYDDGYYDDGGRSRKSGGVGGIIRRFSESAASRRRERQERYNEDWDEGGDYGVDDERRSSWKFWQR